MIKVLITLITTFFIWFGFVKMFGKDNENSINFLSSKFINNFTLIFKNIFELIDSLFKGFILIYELLGSLLKNVVGIIKSLVSSLSKFIMLFKIIGITFLSFISLFIGLFQATRTINLFTTFESIINNIKSAKTNVNNLKEKKEDKKNKVEKNKDENNKESFIPSILNRISLINK